MRFFTRCLSIELPLKRCWLVQNVKFFSSNCSKFAVECGWDSKISHNVQNLGFCKKIYRWVFSKNSWFFQIAKGSKFAVGCDWNSKNSQNVQNLGVFWKIDGFFEKKNCFFFEVEKGGKFDVECVSNGITSWKCLFRPHYEVFLAKKQKTSNIGKIRKYDEEKVLFFRGKNVFIFLSCIFIKLGKRKIWRC